MDAKELRTLIQDIVVKHDKPAVYFLCKQSEIASISHDELDALEEDLGVVFVGHGDSILCKII